MSGVIICVYHYGWWTAVIAALKSISHRGGGIYAEAGGKI